MTYARRPRVGILSAATLLLCTILTSLPGITQESVLDSVPTLETLVSKLDLSPAQQAQLRPIFQKRTSELQETQNLLQRATTSEQKEAVLRDAKTAGDAFNSQVESVLTPSQTHDWREIRSQVHERVKERTDK